MEDTYPLTDSGFKLLQEIDNKLNNPNFPDLTDIAINITKEEFLKKFKEIGSHKESWNKLLKNTKYDHDPIGQ